MSVLGKYFNNNNNKIKAYEFATNNTKYNIQFKPMISKDDEWVNEIEWNELFDELKEKDDG